jgi:hypothetical protein
MDKQRRALYDRWPLALHGHQIIARDPPTQGRWAEKIGNDIGLPFAERLSTVA